jgi:hypothetical protein
VSPDNAAALLSPGIHGKHLGGPQFFKERRRIPLLQYLLVEAVRTTTEHFQVAL